jgi:hypothetical protein
MFTECVQRIEKTYVELGYIHGWRFLYTAVDTLEKPARLIFLGLNPSLPEGEEAIIIPNVQRGNAFRVEQWGDRGTRLQKQVKMFFQFLATRLEQDRDQFMDTTLTLNFCPFRSPGWECLRQLNGPVAFSRELLRSICQFSHPSAIVCMGLDTPYGEVKTLYQDMGYNEPEDEQTWNTGWGNHHCRGQTFTNGGHELLIVGLPHLSRYGIFLRQEPIDIPDHVQYMFDRLRDRLI